jgi:hypothetical protein
MRYHASREDAYLVLEVDGRIEVRNLGVDALAEYLALDVVDERSHFCFPISTLSKSASQVKAYRRLG